MKAGKYRSGFEKKFAEHLKKIGVPFVYEGIILPYHQLLFRKYYPDFAMTTMSKKSLTESGYSGILLAECKGVLTASDRKKHLAIKECHPHADIRFIFMADNYLTPKKRKKGDGTGGLKYSTWCEKHGFKYFVGHNPPKSFFS